MSNANMYRSTKRVNMSKRKPVPVFVPSRPSSLISISGFTPFAAVGIRSQHPPLPQDWREHIEKALTVEPRDSDATQYVERGTGDVSGVAAEPALSDILETCSVKVPQPALTRSVPSGRSSLLSDDSTSSSTHGRHKTYHPPTPPANTRLKFPRVDLFNHHDRNSFNTTVYPDLPTSAQSPNHLRANIFPVSFDPDATTNASMTVLGSRDDFHSQFNHDMTGAPKFFLPSRKELVRAHRPNIWTVVWLQLKRWGGSMRLRIVRLFSFTRTPGAVTY